VEGRSPRSRPAGGRRVEVIAHRGFSGAAPENTLSAVREAIRAGADRIEFDVLLSSDGEPVVFHDATLDRTTDGHGPLAALTLAELRSLDAGRWFSPRHAGERVPTLDEVLEECGDRIPVNVEIKEEAVEAGSGPSPRGIEARVAGAIRRHGLVASAVVSSFEPRALRRLGALLPEAKLESLYNERLHAGRGPGAVCAEVGSRGFSCSRDEVSTAWVEESHRSGLLIKVYTADEPMEMERLVGLGVDGIFTNHPDRLLRLLGRMPRPAGSKGG
jgi:glycerophosphoryl diester phosphodiesterase